MTVKMPSHPGDPVYHVPSMRLGRIGLLPVDNLPSTLVHVVFDDGRESDVALSAIESATVCEVCGHLRQFDMTCPIAHIPVETKVEEPNGRARILRTAESLVNGDRRDTYGSARESFDRIGALWGIVLGIPPIPGWKAALMLGQLKVSRILSSPDHDDSWVDLAGYAALGGELATEPDGDHA